MTETTTKAAEPLTGITIDGPTSKDLDDAIRVRELGRCWEVLVCVADVAKAVPKGHALDVGTEEKPGAYGRVETRYFASGNQPMLPRDISEGSASLFEGRPKDVMAIRMLIDRETLDPTQLPEVSFHRFKSLHRLSFHDVPEILAEAKHPLHAEIQTLTRLSDGLVKKRRRDGAMVIYDLNSGWATDEDGILQKLEFDEANVGYVIVQELMILANAELARWAAERELPILFRNHTAKAHAPERAEVVEQMRTAIGQPLAAIDVFRRQVNLMMNRADYGPTLKGHYGLNVPAYVHATSPIRRYADLVTQRQVRASVLGEPLPYTRAELIEVAKHINDTIQERREATEAFHKSKAKAEAERASSRRDSLAALTEKEFDRVVKSVRDSEEPPEAFVKNALERLSNGTLSALSKQVLLLGTPRGEKGAKWLPIREAIMARFAVHPPEASMVANMAIQTGELGPLTFEGRREGQDHCPTFASSVRAVAGDRTLCSGWESGASAKLAQQKATARLLAVMTGLAEGVATPASTPGATSTAPPLASKAPPMVPVESDNPVSALQEFSQATGVAAPDYSFDGVGPSHAPTFLCTCSFGSVYRNAKAATKKEAKKLAAGLVVAALREAAQQVDAAEK